jgi:NADH-quinone oxidoreductase subunit H
MTEWFQGTIGYGFGWFVATLILVLMIALPLMLAVAMIIYADRKIWAAMALRRGPNVVGPFGLLQSFADGLKVMLKETIVPSAANRGLFLIAPILTFTLALIGWAVIPFGPGMVLSDINVGLLYILAVSSAQRLRRRHRRLGVQLQISLLFGAPRGRADGELRRCRSASC